MYDSEIACVEHEIHEELIYTTLSSNKLQPRKVKCKAHWNDAIGMAEETTLKRKLLGSEIFIQTHKKSNAPGVVYNA
ncbi:hypothetical protein AKJ16_DCAP05898 [Drosera capensis]